MVLKKKPVHPYPEHRYPLDEIKRLVKEGKVLIRPNALDGARNAFGWGIEDILDVIRKLERKHFQKSDASIHNRFREFEFYKAKIKGENVYIHLYIDDDTGSLIINSFKENRKQNEMS